MTLKLQVQSATMREHEIDRALISVGRGPLHDLVLNVEGIPKTLGTFVRQDTHYEWVSDPGPTVVQLFRDGRLQYKSQNAKTRWTLQNGDEIKVLGAEVTIRVLACDPTAGEPKVHRLNLARDEHPAIHAEVAQTLAEHPQPGTLLRIIAGLAVERTKARPLRVFITSFDGDDLPHRETWAICPTQFEGVMAVGIVEQAVDPATRLARHAGPILEALRSSSDALLVDHDNLRSVFVPMGSPARAYATFDFGPDVHDSALLHQVALAAHEVAPLAKLCFDLLDTRKTLAGSIEENRYYRERERRHYSFKELVAESPAMRHVFELLNAQVDSVTPVLIVGEAGTGKELLARALHHFGNTTDEPTRRGMLFSLNCSPSDDTDIDVELFGCVASEFQGRLAPRKGIFELAADGTVFLEEIELLSPMIQGKLVRMLKESEVRRAGDTIGRPVRARLVASTHRDLEELVDTNKLRRDLYLILKETIFRVPSLRERHDDILPLARTFLKNYSKRYGKTIHRFDDEVQQQLLAHTWPGNVRELQMRVEAAVLKCESEAVAIKDFGFE